MSRTKSTRVEFREQTVCTYTDSKFLQQNPTCNKFQFTSITEEFEPDTISQEHYDFTINRNQAIPQPLAIPTSINPARPASSISTAVQPSQYTDIYELHEQGLLGTRPNILNFAGKQTVGNFSKSISDLHKMVAYNELLEATNDGSIELQDMAPDATAAREARNNAPTQDDIYRQNASRRDRVTSAVLDDAVASAMSETGTDRARLEHLGRPNYLDETVLEITNMEAPNFTLSTELTEYANQRGFGTRGVLSEGAGSSTDPLGLLTNTGLPVETLNLSFDFPIQLQGITVPVMPDPTTTNNQSIEQYSFERAIYDTQIADLLNAIDASTTIDAQEKAILKRQIALHEEEVSLRAQARNSRIPMDANQRAIIDAWDTSPFQTGFFDLHVDSIDVRLNQIIIEQQIYNDIRKIPIADRAAYMENMSQNPQELIAKIGRTGSAIPDGFAVTNSDVVDSIMRASYKIDAIILEHPPVTQLTPSQQTTIAKQAKLEKFKEIMSNVSASELGQAALTSLVGMGVGALVAHLAGESTVYTNIQNTYARGAAIGASAGAAGVLPQVAARFASIALRGATAGLSLERALVSSAISSISEIATGAIIGAALVPLDMLFQDYLIRNGFTHAGAGALSGATMGAIGVVASTGIAIGLESFAAGALTVGTLAAPATLGTSVILALGTIAFSAIAGAVSGALMDKDQRIERNRINVNRRWVVANLRDYNFDVIKTIQAFEIKHYGGLISDEESNFLFGDYETDMRPFIEMLQETFEGRTFEHSNNPAPELNKREKDIQALMARDVFVTLREIAQQEGELGIVAGIDAIGTQPLTPEEVKFMNENTNQTWFNDSYLTAEIQFSNMKFDQKKSSEAQPLIYKAWNDTKTLDYDPELLKWARKDASFEARFTQARIYDSQQIIMSNFQAGGMGMDENLANIITMANTIDPLIPVDNTKPPPPTFRELFTNYTTQMTTQAATMNISVPQLLDLQVTPIERRERLYLQYQYNTLRTNTLTADELASIRANDAQNISIFNMGFYSRDDYILENSTPEEYENWNPYDSQIYQANLSGMTLVQYMNYLHLLGQGEQGSFNNLPEYTPEAIANQRENDRIAFERQLALTGHTGEFVYNTTTKRFEVYQPESSNRRQMSDQPMPMTMSAPPVRDPYLPRDYQDSTENFHTMTHGLNEQNQKAYDDYNLSLLSDLEDFRLLYDRQVRDYNDYQRLTGQRNFLFFDIDAEYHQHRLTYNPISENPNDYIDDTINEFGGSFDNTGKITEYAIINGEIVAITGPPVPLPDITDPNFDINNRPPNSIEGEIIYGSEAEKELYERMRRESEERERQKRIDKAYRNARITNPTQPLNPNLVIPDDLLGQDRENYIVNANHLYANPYVAPLSEIEQAYIRDGITNPTQPNDPNLFIPDYLQGAEREQYILRANIRTPKPPEPTPIDPTPTPTNEVTIPKSKEGQRVLTQQEQERVDRQASKFEAQAALNDSTTPA